MAAIQSYKINLFARTDVGKERDHNEDNFIICPNLASIDDWHFDKDKIQVSAMPGMLLVVADGLGGLNAGEIASEIAITAIREYFTIHIIDKKNFSDKAIKQFLRKAIFYANDAIQEAIEVKGNMGTTIILGWLMHTTLHLAWVGDSRAYLYRKNAGLTQISEDHSLVQQLINNGEITKAQAFYHPNGNIITQCLGDKSENIQPDFRKINLQPEDFFFLCSDGLNGMLTDEEIEKIIKTDWADKNNCMERLVDAANHAGGTDNITITSCFITSLATIPPQPKKKQGYLVFMALAVLLSLSFFLLSKQELPLATKAKKIMGKVATNKKIVDTAGTLVADTLLTTNNLNYSVKYENANGITLENVAYSQENLLVIELNINKEIHPNFDKYKISSVDCSDEFIIDKSSMIRKNNRVIKSYTIKCKELKVNNKITLKIQKNDKEKENIILAITAKK